MGTRYLSRPEFYAGCDFKQTEALNMRLHSATSAPGTPVGGQAYYNSVSGISYVYDGSATAWVAIKDTWVSSLGAGTSTTVGGTTAVPVVNVTAASASVPGSMTAAHFSLLTGATASATASTLVLRDSSGNFAASTATTAGRLTTAVTINGTSFDGSTNVTVTAAAGTLTGTVLNSTVVTSSLTALGAQTQALNMNSQKVTGLADGTAAGDAINLGQLQSAQAGLDVKASVRVATAAALATYSSSVTNVLTASANGALVVDGVTVAVTSGLTNRVLVKSESGANAKFNGIYDVTATGSAGAPWVLTRSADADASSEVTSGCYVFVSEGTAAATTGWVLSTADPITLNSTNLSFTQYNGAGSVVAGDGVSVTGNTVTAVGTANRISVSAGGIDISANYVGQTTITTLGTITAGTWTAGTINGVTVTSSSGTLNMATHNLTLSANATLGGTSSGSNTGDQTVSITGDGVASGSVGVLTLAVTKINGVSLAGLGTGILKNTTSTGAPSIAVASDFPTLNQNTTGNASTATTAGRLTIAVTINGTSFDGSTNVTVTAAAGTLTGTVLNSTVVTSSLTSVGTISAGAWQSTTAVGLAYGGTGSTTDVGARSVLGAMGRYAATITGDASAASFTVTHSLSTRDVIVSVIQTSVGDSQFQVVITDVEATSTSAVTVSFATPPATGVTYRVVVAAVG